MDTYQLPVMDGILPKLSKARVFFVVDLRSAYWHCIIDSESSAVTTFVTPYGWRRLSFEVFQRQLYQTLELHPYTELVNVKRGLPQTTTATYGAC